jgi:hypothetical protein
MKKRIFLILLCMLSFFIGIMAQQTSDNRLSQDSIPTVEIKEVRVTAKIYQSSSYQFTAEETKLIVTTLGEPDLTQHIATLPGVSQGMEGASGLFIRGGNSGNNRLELNGVPLYGNSHLFGLISALPTDIIKTIDFRTGGIPSSSGDLLSSLTQVSTGLRTKKVQSSVSLSPYFVSGYSGGQFSSDSLWSYQVAGRYSLLQPIAKLLFSGSDYQLSPFVVDLYAAMNYQIAPMHKLTIESYLSRDRYQLSDDDVGDLYYSSNSMYKLEWQWLIGDCSLLKTFVYNNQFLTGQKQQSKEDGRIINEISLNSELYETTIKSIFSTKLKQHVYFSAGTEIEQQRIRPSNKKYSKANEVSTISEKVYNPFTSALFGELRYDWQKWAGTLGLRETYYHTSNRDFFKTDVHLNLQYYFFKDMGVEFCYDRLNQFHHVVEGLPTGWSMDLIIPSTSLTPPEIADQFYLGSFFRRDRFCLSLGGYYKSMKNLVSYINAFNVFNTDNAEWEENVCTGNGSSYGIELQSKYVDDRFQLSLSYTLSKSDRCFEKINEGKAYPAKFDRRHIINMLTQVNTVSSRKKSQHINLNVSLTSGNHATIPVATYDGILPPFWNSQSGSNTNSTMDENAYSRQLMSSVNGYDMPTYFRIDIGYCFIKKSRYSEHELTLGVYNVLNRKNPYLIFYEDGTWKQLSILPIMPSVNWKIQF